MKLKQVISVIALFCLSFAISLKAQNNKEKEIEGLANLYTNLEYNTIAFNDLKKKWIVSDPLLVRDVFNRFVVKNALRRNGKELNSLQVKKIANDIQNGNVIIFLRKRYYDNQIEYFAFLPFSEIYKANPHPLADSVIDGFYLKNIIGNALYKKLQDKSYFYSTITKKIFETRAGYYFKVYLNLLRPEIMFWSTTSKKRNKYLVSFFGKWGNDNLMLPAYFLREYLFGLRITYFDVISTIPIEYTYKVSLGLGTPSNIQNPKQMPKNVNFFKSGSNIYLGLSGQPFKQIFPNIHNLFIDLEFNYTLFDYKYEDYHVTKTLNFYSIKNYLTFKITKKEIFDFLGLGLFQASIGFSAHDLKTLQLNSTKKEVVDLKPNLPFSENYQKYLLTSIGLFKFGGLMNYNFDIDYMYNLNDSYSYLGFDLEFLVSDNFGIDLRYYKGLSNIEDTINWRKNYYFVFSPVIKINY